METQISGILRMRIMFIFITTLFVAILNCITGCSDISSSSQNYDVSENVSFGSEVLSLDETDESYNHENVPDEILQSFSGGNVITNTSKEDSDENISGEMSSEAREDIQVPNAIIPAIMIDGTIYYLSHGYPIPDKEINLDQINYTESEIPLYTYPEKDGESNYAPAGTPYVKHENGYALKIDEYGWTLFLTWEDRLAEE